MTRSNDASLDDSPDTPEGLRKKLGWRQAFDRHDKNVLRGHLYELFPRVKASEQRTDFVEHLIDALQHLNNCYQLEFCRQELCNDRPVRTLRTIEQKLKQDLTALMKGLQPHLWTAPDKLAVGTQETTADRHSIEAAASSLVRAIEEAINKVPKRTGRPRNQALFTFARRAATVLRDSRLKLPDSHFASLLGNILIAVVALQGSKAPSEKLCRRAARVATTASSK